MISDRKSLPGAPHCQRLSEGKRCKGREAMSDERRAALSKRMKLMWAKRKNWKRRIEQRA
jgi:hypothetical protein